MNYKTIRRWFDDDRKANAFYLDLCDKYDMVELTHAPLFSLTGYYAWRVAKPTNQ